jgi:signal transduction histidine kinase/CheY-like chemotaxis protein
VRETFALPAATALRYAESDVGQAGLKDGDSDAATLAAATLARARLAATLATLGIAVSCVAGPLAGIPQPPLVYGLNAVALSVTLALALALRAGKIGPRHANLAAAAVWLPAPLLTLATLAITGSPTLVYPILLEVALVAAAQADPRWILGTAAPVVAGWAVMALTTGHPERLVALTSLASLTAVSAVVAAHLRRGALAEARHRRELVANADRLRQELAERHRAEEERERLRDQFVHAQRVEVVGTLAAGVAHDLNNILGGIVGLAEAASEDVGLVDPRADLAQIVAEAQRGAELTRTLLTHARRGPERRRELRVDGVLDQLGPLLSRTLTKQVTVERRGSTDAVVDADAAHLAQVVLNLCLNGADAMDGVGSLTVTSGVAELDAAEASGFGVPAGRYATIAVTDTGRGIDETVRARIFEPFFTTKPVGKGTGLGLAMVQGTVRNHGGTIAVASELGRGTTFTIYLPAITPARVEAPPANRATPLPRAARGVALVVDDEPLIRAGTTRILERMGLTVIGANDGAEALEVFLARGAEIVVVVLDLAMPVMSGIECFRKLRARSAVPILLVSGLDPDNEVRDLLASGAAAFLDKPFPSTTLQAMVGQLMASPPPATPPSERMRRVSAS